MRKLTLCFILALLINVVWTLPDSKELDNISSNRTLAQQLDKGNGGNPSPDEADDSRPADKQNDPTQDIEVVSSDDSTAMLRSIEALIRRLNQKIEQGDVDYQKHKEALLEQEILLIELNNADFDRSGIMPPKRVQFNWEENVITILQPLFSSLRTLTIKPRQASEYKESLDYAKKRVASFKHGVEVLSELKARNAHRPREIKTIDKVYRYWQKKLNEAENTKKNLEWKIAELEEEKPLSEQVDAGIAKAFMYKLTTIVLALLAAAITYIIFNWLAHFFKKHEHKIIDKDAKLFYRLWCFSLRLFSGIAAISSIFIIIYFRSDWVLLALGLIILFFLFVGLKDTLPGYITEIRTVLNLGSVKTGERIIYQGIPWKIVRLGMYCHLHNPALDAHFHIALSQLADLNSRPYHSDEPFFPTGKGDWVRLSNGVFGKVLMQSLENVVLSSWKSVITIPTGEFLNLTPKNLSIQQNFVTTVFGIDYAYQPVITTEARQKLEEFVQSAPCPDSFAQHIESISVDFKEANASSLDFLVFCLVSGDGAEFLYVIERWLQATCVDAANHYGWKIPFQQITLHQENP